MALTPAPEQPQPHGLALPPRHAIQTVEPRVVHSMRGRLRLHLPLWSGKGERQIEQELGGLHGVRSIQANAVTGNVLLLYDPELTSEQALLAGVRDLPIATVKPSPPRAELPPVVTESRGNERRARIAMRGVDRNAVLARQVVDLFRKRGVRAWAKPLTGHILVEYDQYQHVLKELIALVAHVELPSLPGEDRPEHPLDPMPLWQGLIRAVVSLIGLGILTSRRLAAPAAAATAGHGIAGAVAGAFNLLHGIPPIRKLL